MKTGSVTIIGAGPAGLAAAAAAAPYAAVTLLDENPGPGGQIWRAGAGTTTAAAELWEPARQAGAQWLGGCRVVAADAHALLLENATGAQRLPWEKLVLAPGARERFLPFPGWTLPGVLGAGGLQALVKNGLDIRGQRVMVAGSGPLLLAVAAFLRSQGAIIAGIAEQATRRQLAGLAWASLGSPEKRKQASGLFRQLRGVPYLTHCWVEAAEVQESSHKNSGWLAAVRLRRGNRRWREPCDWLASGFGLAPNIELARLLGCALAPAAEGWPSSIAVDDFQLASQSNIWCAGEITGIGGLELSLLEGRIAGLAAAGQTALARRWLKARNRRRHFARALARAARLDAELRRLPGDETIICRCEDVPLGRLREYHSWREARLLGRCGMGACQGRICSDITGWLWNWQYDTTRPPVTPARISTLALMAANAEKASSSEFIL